MSNSVFQRVHIPPMDEHNKKLIYYVHPPDWVNPQPADCYDLVVIGAGTAGLVVAAGAAGLDVVGVEYNRKEVKVNDYFQTANPKIYAAGILTACEVPSTKFHEAEAEGIGCSNIDSSRFDVKNSLLQFRTSETLSV
jgi:predicted flavoprotein YhiN